MRKLFICILTASCFNMAHSVQAQAPKWYKKAQKPLLSIITFDQNNDILHSGNGFFVDQNGTGLANYRLFKGAYKAKAVDSEGKEHEVKWICGANSLYDVVKFRIITDKHVPSIILADKHASKGDVVYLLPYATQKNKSCRPDTILSNSTFADKYAYYSLTGTPNNLMTNVPLMNNKGEAIALLQSSSDGKNNYAISAQYGFDLTTNALSSTDNDLNEIHIPKLLPQNEQDATTFLFLANSNDSVLYADYLSQFIHQFPKNHNGYTAAAEFYVKNNNFESANKILSQGLESVSQKDQLHYAWSRLIYNLCVSGSTNAYADWNMQRAWAEAQKAYQINNLPIYLVQEGNCLYALGKYQDACDTYLSVSNTSLESSDIYLYAAQCKKMLQAPSDEILALQDSALNMHQKPYKPEVAPILLARANTYMDRKEYKKAVLDLNDYESLNLGQLNANFYYLRAQAEQHGKMYEMAVTDINKATRLEPNNPVLWAQKASMLYTVGLIDEAITAAKESIKLSPEFPDAHRILGVCLVQNNQKEAGLSALKKAKELGDSMAEQLIEKAN